MHSRPPRICDNLGQTLGQRRVDTQFAEIVGNQKLVLYDERLRQTTEQCNKYQEYPHSIATAFAIQQVDPNARPGLQALGFLIPGPFPSFIFAAKPFTPRLTAIFEHGRDGTYLIHAFIRPSNQDFATDHPEH
jgi:hypothetical protein